MILRANHVSLLGALMMRELSSRFGRRNIGFFWIMAEPALFCIGIIVLWSFIKPPSEHGLPVAAFAMTGYLPLLVVRNSVSQGAHCITANNGLLYHRNITLLHLFVARMSLEYLGIALAALVIASSLIFFGFVSLPEDILKILIGFGLLCWFSFGLALAIGSLASRFEVVERVSPIASYLLLPISGAFFMLSWLPSDIRSIAALVPMVHAFEYIREGFFGESLVGETNLSYLIGWNLALSLIGLLSIRVIASADVE